MAKVKPSPLYATIVGSVGTITFQQYNTQTLVAKQKILKSTQPFSGKQVAIQTALGALSAFWNAFLTPQEKNAWEQFGYRLNYDPETSQGSRAIIRGNVGHLNGYNSFISVNILRASLGITAVLRAAPLTQQKPITPFYIATWSGPGNSIRIDLTPLPLPFTYTYVRIWIASRNALFHKQILGLIIPPSTTEYFAQVTGKAGTAILFEHMPSNTPVLIQADQVNALGLASPPSTTSDLLVGGGI